MSNEIEGRISFEGLVNFARSLQKVREQQIIHKKFEEAVSEGRIRVITSSVPTSRVSRPTALNPTVTVFLQSDRECANRELRHGLEAEALEISKNWK